MKATLKHGQTYSDCLLALLTDTNPSLTNVYVNRKKPTYQGFLQGYIRKISSQCMNVCLGVCMKNYRYPKLAFHWLETSQTFKHGAVLLTRMRCVLL